MSSSPDDDEFEISLFGPGYGESIIVHLGGGNWIAIDSCVDPTDNTVVPLKYLQKIGVVLEEQIKLIIATHWHDDHIRGLSSLYNACPKAELGFPNAFTKKEFLEIILANCETDPSPLGKSTTEMGAILSKLQERKRIPKYLSVDRLVLSLQEGGGSNIYSLSPDDSVTEHFLNKISQLFPVAGRPQRRLGAMTPNEISAAILMTFDDDAAIFGADLEENPGQGWSKIMANSQSLTNKVSVFKIPHHGSVTGHCEAFWKSHMIENVLAILAPWNRARKLPRDSDIQRIITLTSRAYSTASPESVSSTRRATAVSKSIAAMGIKLELNYPRPGHVRLRRKAGQKDWTIKLGGTAKELKHLSGWETSGDEAAR